MMSAGLSLLALLAFSAGVWGQQLNAATDFLDIPETSCTTNSDCGGSERGRCITNWPKETFNEELARLLLPEFESGNYYPVCECNRIGGQMPKGPHCEDDLDIQVRTCNSNRQCGGAEKGGRCLFREDGYGYCVCRRGRTGDRCHNKARKAENDVFAEQVLGPGNYMGNYGYYGGFPNVLGYQPYNTGYFPSFNLGYQRYGGYFNQPYYGGNRGYQPYNTGFYNGAYLANQYLPNNRAYQLGTTGYYGNYYQPGYLGYQVNPYVGAYPGYQGYQPYVGSLAYPRTTYYQNYPFLANQIVAYPGSTYYQPYSYNNFPYSLYALQQTMNQYSGYNPNAAYGYPYNIGYAGALPTLNGGYYGANAYRPYGVGAAFPNYYGAAFPNYGATFPNYGATYPNYGATFPNYGVNFPNYGTAFPNYGAAFPNYGAAFPNYGAAFPNYGAAFPNYYGAAFPRNYPGYATTPLSGYYGQPVGYVPGMSYRPGGTLYGNYPAFSPTPFIFGTPYYYSGAGGLPGAPYNFYGSGNLPGRYPVGFSPAPGATGYRPGTAAGYPYANPGIGFSQAPLAGAPYGYPVGFNAGYMGGYGGGLLRFNKVTGTYQPIGAVEALGGPAIGASPIPGVTGDPAIIAAGGNPILANEGKAGGWEPSVMPALCNPAIPNGGFCKNGGRCQNNSPFGVTCSCPLGFRGRSCETEIGAQGLQHRLNYRFGCGCPLAVNGPGGVTTVAGQPLAAGSCMNPCVMTPADRFRFVIGGAPLANPAFNSDNMPDLFPTFEAGPAAFLQCGERNHPAGNCAIRRCAPGTIFSFGAQVCTTDDIGANTPIMPLGAVPGGVVNPAAVGGAFPGVLPGVSPVGAAFPGTAFPGNAFPGAAYPFKKK